MHDRDRPTTGAPPATRWHLVGIVLGLLGLRILGFVLLAFLIVSTALLVIRARAAAAAEVPRVAQFVDAIRRVAAGGTAMAPS